MKHTVADNKNIVVFDIREIYHELGKFSFKIVFNKKFKNCFDAKVSIVDSNNNNIDLETQYWGRKINCCFLIDANSPQGVYTLKVKMDCLNETVNENFNFWVIK